MIPLLLCLNPAPPLILYHLPRLLDLVLSGQQLFVALPDVAEEVLPSLLCFPPALDPYLKGERIERHRDLAESKSTYLRLPDKLEKLLFASLVEDGGVAGVLVHGGGQGERGAPVSGVPP